MIYLALLTGGIIGGMLRYVIEVTIPTIHSFPLSTLFINLVGSFILGLFYGVADGRHVKPWLRVGLAPGVIGTFTTFSAFCFDMTQIASKDLLLVYALGSILGGPLLAFLGNQTFVVVSGRALRNAEELSA